ncbi:MAG: DUF2752 domain-containing protein [Clostridiales bacterium]|nr:DUF2752 domain-containing protein [Clostridiales bacterium]
MNKKLLVRHVIIIAVLLSYCLILYITRINCPVRALFGYPCPTCGITRGLLSLVTFDFRGYFRYHPLALPILVAFCLGIHRNNKVLNRAVVKYYIIVTALATVLLYVYRLEVGFDF